MTETGPNPSETLRANLRATLAGKGAPSRAAVAKAAGVGGSTLNDFLAGTIKSLTLDKAAAIAAELDTTIGALTGEAPGRFISDASAVIGVPFDRLMESPRNPRKSFDGQALAELADSIADKGLLQNLVVRPLPAGFYSITAGARRYRALALLRGAGRPVEGVAVADYPVACRVIATGDEAGDDAEQLVIAITENLQRDDFDPMDEAEAFLWLRDHAGWGTDEIATRIARTRRHVQKRIALTERLGKAAQVALRENRISLAAAQALTIAPAAEQPEAVEAIAEGRYGWQTETDIRQHIADDKAPASWAIFDLAAYDGEIIEIEPEDLVEDVEAKKRRFFADTAQFERLQREAAEAKVEELAKEWAWAELWDKAERGWFYRHHYDLSEDRSRAGAIVEIDGDGEVTVHKGLMKHEAADASADASAAGKTPRPHFTRTHLERAKHVKTVALQTAIASDPGAALRLAVLGLLGADAVRIGTEPVDRDDTIRSETVLVRDAGHTTKLGFNGRAHRVSEPLLPELLHPYRGEPEAAPRVWRTLRGMDDAGVLEILATLVAGQTGSWAGFNPEIGDAPLVVAVAEDLGVDMAPVARAQIADDAYLKTAGKPHLIEIVGDAEKSAGGGRVVDAAPGQFTGKQLRAEIAAHLEAGDLDGYVPRELRFGATKDLEADALAVPALMDRNG